MEGRAVADGVTRKSRQAGSRRALMIVVALAAIALLALAWLLAAPAAGLG